MSKKDKVNKWMELCSDIRKGKSGTYLVSGLTDDNDSQVHDTVMEEFSSRTLSVRIPGSLNVSELSK